MAEYAFQFLKVNSLLNHFEVVFVLHFARVYSAVLTLRFLAKSMQDVSCSFLSNDLLTSLGSVREIF